ncbi:MAG: hypoxanthine phosphoribosyltransferase [Chloroflexi bacterium]|nr:hypoxanthine phosphoribosyltransferase [Chloroflexota bacterium]
MGSGKAKLDPFACYLALKGIAQSLNSSLPLRQALHLALRSAAKAGGVSGTAIVLLDSSKKHLLHVVSYGLTDWYVRKGLLDVDKSMGESLQGEPVVVLNAATDPRVQYRDLAKRAGITSVLSIPLKDKTEVIGALRAYSHEERHFGKAEIGFFEAVANSCALALESARMLENLEGGHDAPQENMLSAAGASQVLAAELRRPAQFAHPSEEEFAKLLDFYRIEWLYEPRSFALQLEGDNIAEMFTPDFYLPELDLYVELTTMKQSLATDKNRKIRRLRELYPGTNIILLNRSGFAQLLAKYGYGLRGETKVVRVLLSSTQLQRKVRSLGKKISRDYAGKKLVLVGVLKGVVPFLSDLMQNISLPLAVDFMSISYYSEVSGQVKITKDLDTSITDMDVLMVEDIVDTGMTLNYVLNYLRARNPASLKVCALLDKRTRRLADVHLDYVGFEIPDEFLVGYGLDHLGMYRNLPFVGVLSPDAPVHEKATQKEGPEQPCLSRIPPLLSTLPTLSPLTLMLLP